MSWISKKGSKKGKHTKENKKKKESTRLEKKKFKNTLEEKNKKEKKQKDVEEPKKEKGNKNQENKRIEQEKNPKKKKGPIRRFFGTLFWLFFIVVISVIVVFCMRVKENGGGIRGAIITVLGLTVEEVESLEPINVLLLGISEDINSKLTDTIIVCSYNPKSQKASMISIPRDTFVGKNKASAKGTDKINSLYAKSPEKLLKKVSDITGIELENYAVINTNALIKIVDIVGGVNFEVPIDMDYDDPTQDLHIHLEQGMQKIDGKKAEQLLRFRHNNDGSSYPVSYGDNDYGRMKTQRAFITETIKQTLTIENLENAKDIYNVVLENVETNMDIKGLLKYAPTLIDFDMNSITSEQLPGQSEKCNELWFYIYNQKRTKELVQELEIK